jgi:hypothetical protein
MFGIGGGGVSFILFIDTAFGSDKVPRNGSNYG